MSKKLIKSGIIVSGMTLASRVMGLVRDVVIANLLGAGVAADVFFFANRIPNFLRRLFAEGAFNQAFVPVMTEYRKKGDESEVRELLAAVAGTLGGIVTVVTLLGVLGSGVLTALFGWGWFWDWLHGGPAAEKFEMASLMLKITFPYLWFITFTAMAGAILNTFGRFGVSSFTPIFLNITMIAAAWWISPWLDNPELALAIGVFLGGLVQFLFQFPFLRQINMLVRPKWGWHHPGVVKIRTLMIPALFGVSVSQINLLLNTMLASFLATGAISHLYYSDRLLEFPLGMFGVAISTVILPALAKKHVDADPADFSRTMDWGVRMVMLLGMPAMVGIAVLREPILRVLFMRGEFGLHEVTMSSASLLASTSGLLSLMLIKVLAPGYYARQDTKTPVRIGMMSMAANMACNLVFIYPLGYVGLALSTACSGTLNALLLFKGLYKQSVYRPSRHTGVFCLKLLAASLLMGGVLGYLSPDLAQWGAWHMGKASMQLTMLLVLGGAIYAGVLLALGIRPRDLRAGRED
ncbi:murein biosynthesis integral membrane protein MurJ [Aeromonas jandaei]|uniref:murein biosynthesis integral membrane protein MurJ n=1 Tax=Aeromonas jandaei TaxID=650 RepID=UPI002B055483|nr:murein biosynthesis integral membrane protein MurJ [Aeromonas jandaei]